MKPVTQTITIGDGSGRPGNCLQAAVASLLDMKIDEVPHFAECDAGEDWLERLVAFGAEHSYRVLYRPEPVPFGLAFGQSPRNASHAVVVIDGKIVWDPHPSRDGLVSVSNYVEWAPLDEVLYVVCRLCGYERVAGEPCGLPCV